MSALPDEVIELIKEIDLINIGVTSHDETWEEVFADLLGLASEDISSDILVQEGDWVRLSEVLLAVSLELVELEWGTAQTGVDVVNLVDGFVLDGRNSLAGEIHIIDLGGLEEEIKSFGNLTSSDTDDWGDSHSVSFHLNPINLDWSSDLVESTNSELLIGSIETILFRNTPSQSGLEMFNLKNVLVILELLRFWNEFSAGGATVSKTLAEEDALHDSSADISTFFHAKQAFVSALFSAQLSELSAESSETRNSCTLTSVHNVSNNLFTNLDGIEILW